MTALMRGGFWRDIVVLVLVTLLLGSGVAWGVGYAVDAFFGDTVRHLVGDVGEYDAIIHLRTQEGEAAESELRLVVDEQLPGAQLDSGVSIAGQTHYFLQLPPDLRNPDTLEGLRLYFQHVPGYNGVTYMIEPSVTVSSVHAARSESIQQAAEAHADVSFVFWSGESLIVVLDSPEATGRVTAYLEEVLAAEDVVEVRFPLGTTLVDPEATVAKLEATLAEHAGERGIRVAGPAEPEEDVDAFVSTLTEMRSLLLAYATRVEVLGAAERIGSRILLMPAQYGGEEAPEPLVVHLEGATEDGSAAWGYVVEGSYSAASAAAWTAFVRLSDGKAGDVIGPASVQSAQSGLAATLAESIRLLHDLEDFATDARATLGAVDQLLAALESGVSSLVTLNGRLDALQQLLNPESTEGQAGWQEVLLPLLLSEWLERSGESEGPLTEGLGTPLDGIELAAVQGMLQRMGERIDAIAALDVDSVVRQIEPMQRLLPHLDDGEIARSVQLIDRNLDGSTIAGDRIELIVPAGFDLTEARPLIEEAVESDAVHIYRVAAGMITPNARTALMQMLGEVRQVIAALVATILVLLTLLLDHSTLFSVWQHHARRRGETRRRVRWIGAGVGALDGAILLTLIGLLSGARLPYVGWVGFILIGGAIGALVAWIAPRVNPVNDDEVVAGEAMGLSAAEVMREIVLPEARPGLFVWLNRRRQHFA